VRDVGDGALVANKVLFVAVGEVLFEDAVEAAGFVLVAVDAILDLLGRITIARSSASPYTILYLHMHTVSKTDGRLIRQADREHTA